MASNLSAVFNNHFEEFKESEILQNRIQLLQQVEPYIGKFYSDLWVRKNILKQTEDDIKQMMEEIKDEGSDVVLQQQDQQGELPQPPSPKPVSDIKAKTNVPTIGSSRP